jgi:hypothetical protein
MKPRRQKSARRCRQEKKSTIWETKIVSRKREHHTGTVISGGTMMDSIWHPVYTIYKRQALPGLPPTSRLLTTIRGTRPQTHERPIVVGADLSRPEWGTTSHSSPFSLPRKNSTRVPQKIDEFLRREQEREQRQEFLATRAEMHNKGDSSRSIRIAPTGPTNTCSPILIPRTTRRPIHKQHLSQMSQMSQRRSAPLFERQNHLSQASQMSQASQLPPQRRPYHARRIG